MMNDNNGDGNDVGVIDANVNVNDDDSTYFHFIVKIIETIDYCC